MRSQVSLLVAIALIVACVRSAPIPDIPAIKVRQIAGPELDLCGDCFSFFSDTENYLIEIIANAGIAGSCSALCAYLPSSSEQEVCNALCDVVGFYEFVNVISNDDIDPVWICNQLTVCPVNTCNNTRCARITSVKVNPPSGPVRTVFTVTVNLQVGEATGTGTTVFFINFTSTNTQWGVETLNEGYTPGTYQVSAQFDSREDDWLYPPGTYPVQVWQCGGDCFDDEHGVVFSYGQGALKITSSAEGVNHNE